MYIHCRGYSIIARIMCGFIGVLYKIISFQNKVEQFSTVMVSDNSMLDDWNENRP